MRAAWFLALVACGASGGHGPDGGSRDADAIAVDGALDAAGPCRTATTFDPTSVPELAIGSDAPDEGISDPSIVYPAAASAGAMAYSAVADQLIRTHVAVSSDHGATWSFAVEANAPEPATIASSDANECPGGTCSGNLISEVASLVYDSTDPNTDAQWKLFAHRYLLGSDGTLHYTIGTITLQTAPSPTGPWTAPAKWIGWISPSAYSSTGVQVNVNSFAGTADCIALTEPAAIVLPGVLDLAVGCGYIAGGVPTFRIELLRSTDHGATFSSVGTLLRADDAACGTAGASLNGADLFVSAGTEYVAATPSDSAGYHGCLVFAISDPAAGTVSRDADGRAIVTREIAPSSPAFSGACTFADGAGGYLLDLTFFQTAAPFHIAVPGIATP